LAKDDVPPLGPVPKKRRQLEGALDVHVAMWLDSDGLTPSERRRVQDEKDRRRRARREGPAVTLGFSGTREGMTPPQRQRVREIMDELGPALARHGMCVGADSQFHDDCRERGVPAIGHPGDQPAMRARCEGLLREEAPKANLVRNKDIARECSVLVAAPKEMREPDDPRGAGTWSTVRYARQRGKPTRVVLPDGSELAPNRASIATTV
jgi:hypothetical protein